MSVGEVLRCGMASPAEALSTVRRPLSMGAVQRFSLGFDAIRTTPVRLPLSMGEALCQRLGFFAGKGFGEIVKLLLYKAKKMKKQINDFKEEMNQEMKKMT